MSRGGRPFLASGPKIEMNHGSNTLLKNKFVTSVINSQFLTGFWKNMNISTSCVAGTSQKKKNTSIAREGRWGDARPYATTGTVLFRYCWNSGMSRLPTIDDCLEC
jgi:hypothetical protein